jgi:hypothetical protein
MQIATPDREFIEASETGRVHDLQIYGKSQGYLGLPMARVIDGDTLMQITAWTPSAEDLAALNAGASVYLSLQAGTNPPPQMMFVGPAPEQLEVPADMPRIPGL